MNIHRVIFGLDFNIPFDKCAFHFLNVLLPANVRRLSGWQWVYNNYIKYGECSAYGSKLQIFIN